MKQKNKKNSKEILCEINFVELLKLLIYKKFGRTNHLNIINLLDYHLGDTEILILMNYVPTD